MALSCKQLRRLYLRGVISFRTYVEVKNLKQNEKAKGYIRKAFCLNSFTDEDCEAYFRFSKVEISELVVLLELPETCVTKNMLSFSGLEALCTLLRRLCYPNRLLELVPMFSRDSSSISRIYTWTLNFVHRRFRHLITTLDNSWLDLEKLNEFANICAMAGSVLPNICGFIDGTIRPICRPKKNQKEQYSGYKKLHCFKYQSLMFPNGLIGKLDGPFNGRRHDSAILHLSGLTSVLQRKFTKSDGTWLKLYGDPGYSNSNIYINVGYKGHTALTSKQKIFNRNMSKLRVNTVSVRFYSYLHSMTLKKTCLAAT